MARELVAMLAENARKTSVRRGYVTEWPHIMVVHAHEKVTFVVGPLEGFDEGYLVGFMVDCKDERRER